MEKTSITQDGMEQISTIKDLLALWPTRKVVSRDTGASLDAVNKWPIQNAIPARFWAALIDSALRHGIEGLTAEVLARLHDHRLTVSATAQRDVA
jgi:hypothetical protein